MAILERTGAPVSVIQENEGETQEQVQKGNRAEYKGTTLNKSGEPVLVRQIYGNPEEIDLTQATVNRAKQIESFNHKLNTLDPFTTYYVEVYTIDSAREREQNSLMWVFNTIIAKEMGTSAKYTHGYSKLKILLPMMYEYKELLQRAEFLTQLITTLPNFSTQVAVAHDMIRTKNLKTAQMTEYISRMQVYYAKKYSVVLESVKKDDGVK